VARAAIARSPVRADDLIMGLFPRVEEIRTGMNTR
jgi:hypothetical protein